MLVYKVLTQAEWQLLDQTGRFDGSPDDLRDGFIHLSLVEQVAGTLEKHFRGRTNLVIVSIDADRLGASLKMEVSRGGALFPHLYRPLALTDVAGIECATT